MTTPLSFAVIGHPIAHSRSPQIHALFARQLGIELDYERIDCPPELFEETVTKFFAASGAGLNITVPFKERAWSMTTHPSARARDAQAVNTLWRVNQEIHGCNTDGVGLVNDLRRLAMPLAQANILLIGAGGAARGVIGPLLDAGCQHLRVINRTVDRAQTLVTNWVAEHHTDQHKLSAGALDQPTPDHSWQLIINATASSLQGQTLPLPSAWFGPAVSAYDMMYGSKPTAFLTQAQQLGCRHLADGLGMLVGQAGESFRIWHGQLPDTAMVIKEIRSQLQSALR